MTILYDLLTRLHETAVSTTIREEGLWFPWIECVHVLSIALVVGTIAFVDLRLLGRVWKSRPVANVIRETVPFAWIAFVFAAISGGLLFASNPLVYAENTAFQLKLALLALAGGNMAIFHLVTLPAVRHLDAAAPLPAACRLGGLLSLILWTAAVSAGRIIGFTLNQFG